MFDDITLTTKKPLDRDYAKRRMRWEPLYEITQIKGDGEADPALSANLDVISNLMGNCKIAQFPGKRG